MGFGYMDTFHPIVGTGLTSSSFRRAIRWYCSLREGSTKSKSPLWRDYTSDSDVIDSGNPDEGEEEEENDDDDEREDVDVDEEDEEDYCSDIEVLSSVTSCSSLSSLEEETQEVGIRLPLLPL